MPIKTSSGKWKWGNVERSSKKELVQTVYGIWKKNGSKGSFSDFLKGTHESIVNEYAGNKYFVKVDPRVQKYGQDSGYETLRSDDGKILGFKNSRGDCVIRALALATGLSYLNVAKKLHIKLDDKGDVPKDYGGTKWATVFSFFHQTAPSSAIFGMKQNLTVKEFARTISRHSKFKNTYFIVGCVDPSREYAHAVFVKNGRYYDSWDSGDWIVVDVFDATNERGINAQDYRNIVQIRRGTKKRYKKAVDAKINESVEERYFVTDLDYNKHIKPILDILKKWNRMEIGNITKHADDKSMKWFGIYKGRSIEDIVALAAVYIDKADKEIFFNQINSGEKGMGKYLTDRMIEHFKKNKNGCDHISWLSDPGSGEKLKDFYRTNFPDAEETEEKNEWWQTSKFTLKLKESYEPPYTLDTIKQKYGDEVYRKLRDDPVHRFRAETGIEVIHKEPTRDEFERIVNNWDLMTPEQKKQSDEFSMKMFGNNNKNRIDLLRKEYDFEVGDKVKIRSGIRCRQSGHTGKIVRIDPPGTYDYDMHGWSSFIVKMDDPNLGTVGFQSGSIEKLDTVKEFWAKNGRYFYCDDCNKNMTKASDDQYIMIDDDLWEYVCKHGGKKLVPDEDVLCRDCIEKRLGRKLSLKDLKKNIPINDAFEKMLKKDKAMTNESVILEDKTSMIKKLVLPDIEDYNDKQNYRLSLVDWFNKHPSYEKRIDWNKWKTLRSIDFDNIIKNIEPSSREKKSFFRKGTGKNAKDFFKNVDGRKFKIIDENDKWLFVAPLNYEAAVFCDSKECGGGSAKWCIGEEDTPYRWEEHIKGKSCFIMAFNKEFEIMPIKDLFTKLKYMIEFRTKIKGKKRFIIWNQRDIDSTNAKLLIDTDRKDLEKLFSKVDINEYDKNTVISVQEIKKGMILRILPERIKNGVYTPPKEGEILNFYGFRNDLTEESEQLLNSIKEIFVPKTIKEISDEGCQRFPNLEKVVFEDKNSSIVIKNHAFRWCYNLIEIKFPQNAELYNEILDLDNKIKTIEIPSKYYDKESNFVEMKKTLGDINYNRSDLKIIPINDSISESLNEAHEIHSYPEKLQPTLERIVKDNEDYELDHAYFNKEGKFIWMRNSKGYFHVFRPVKFVKTPGMTKPFGFKDLILKDNGMLEEVDRLRFTDGNEGLKFLKDKYHLELKTIK